MCTISQVVALTRALGYMLTGIHVEEKATFTTHTYIHTYTSPHNGSTCSAFNTRILIVCAQLRVYAYMRVA